METEHKHDDRDSKELAKDLAYEPVELAWTPPETRRRSYMFFHAWLNSKMAGFRVLNLFSERVNSSENMDVLHDRILWQ